MSRYIDADALKIPSEEMIAKMAVAHAPSIDIVRCQDCKYWRAYETWSECERWTDDPYETAKTKADDFCSRGEREGE